MAIKVLKYPARRIYVAVLLLFALCFPARAEKITLRNGSFFDGRIIKENDEAVWLECAVGSGTSETKILKSEIAAIEAGDSGILKINASNGFNGGAKRIKDSFLVRNIRYGFFMEIAPEFNLEVPRDWEGDYAVSSRPLSAPKNNTVSVDIQVCDREKKARFLNAFRQEKTDPFGYNLGFARKDEARSVYFDTYLCVYDVVSSGNVIYRYLLFPAAGDYGVNLTFVYPRNSDKTLHLKILDMVSTASLVSNPAVALPAHRERENRAPWAGVESDKIKTFIPAILLVAAGLAYFIVSRKKKPADKQ